MNLVQVLSSSKAMCANEVPVYTWIYSEGPEMEAKQDRIYSLIKSFNIKRVQNKRLPAFVFPTSQDKLSKISFYCAWYGKGFGKRE